MDCSIVVVYEWDMSAMWEAETLPIFCWLFTFTSSSEINCGYAHAEAELFQLKEGCVDDESSQSPYVQYIDQMAVLLKKGYLPEGMSSRDVISEGGVEASPPDYKATSKDSPLPRQTPPLRSRSVASNWAIVKDECTLAMNCTVDWEDPPSNAASELPFIPARSWADPAACLSENEIIRTTQAVMVVNTGSGWRVDRKYLNTIEKIQLQQWSHAKQGVHKLFKEEGDRDTTPIAESLKNLQMLYYRLFRFEPGSVWNRFENAPMPAQLCRVCPDPTPDHLRRVCHTARRSTTERIVFHYLSYHSGSGVTDSQPIGLHGRSLPMYNQALDECSPIGIHKLIGWLAKPTIYIFDCDFAGSYVDSFHEAGVLFPDDGGPSHHASSNSNSTYILASCGRHEQNPHLGPTLPSQLLTACLTAPLKTSLQFL
ncbi:hypothetical protein FOZ63_005431, partial [Perkinsus olseni]